jgi:hypothetical protein
MAKKKTDARRYAINIADLTHDEIRIPVQMLVGPVTHSRNIVKAGPDIDEVAVVLECDEARAESICDFMATAGLERGCPVRCYSEGSRGAWRELRRKGGR